MNIVLLGHDDIASLFAMSCVVAARPEHVYYAFLSGPLSNDAAVPPGLAALAAVDRALCENLRATGSVPPAVAGARLLPAPNTAEGLALLSAAAPDLIVSIRYRRILREPAIAIPRHGVLNLHSGILPHYQGVMATFWALLAGAAALGCTLHRIVDGGIDTGPVIGIATIPADRGASYLRNLLGLYPPGLELVGSAIDALASGAELSAMPQASATGQYFSTPDAAALARFEAAGLRLVDGREDESLAQKAEHFSHM